MKHLFLSLIAMTVLPVAAQDVVTTGAEAVPVAVSMPQAPALKFGHLSYNQAFEAMPDYAIAQQNMRELKVKYEAEMTRVEKEFNEKYEDFLEGQRDFPPSILRKRQMELQELMTKNVMFKEESRKLLEQAREDVYAPLHDKLAQVLTELAEANGLAFILNTDDHACPYLNPAMGIDLNEAVRQRLQP